MLKHKNSEKLNCIVLLSIKIILSLTIALIFMHYFCYCYYNIPIHYNNNKNTTDYIWEKHKFYSQMREGFAYGTTNNEGFNNLSDYNKNDNIDILLIGSSQMQAFNVLQNENTATLLNNLFDKKLYTYNIGIDGHFLPTLTKNIENSLKYYKPKKYIIIETQYEICTNQKIEELLSGNLAKVNTTKGGIKAFLQKNHFLHLMNTQIAKMQGEKQKKAKNNKIEDEYTQDKIILTNEMLSIIKRNCEKYNITPIILYHTQLHITKSLDDKYINKVKNINTFKELCKKNDIIFIDMTPIFNENYNKQKVFPYGFANTTPNSGHLNRNGHKMIAEELYKVINNLEESKSGI